MSHSMTFSTVIPFVPLFLCLQTLAIAQDTNPTPENDQPINPLVAKQEMIRDRLVRLEDRMFRLREKLLDDEPDNAARVDAHFRSLGYAHVTVDLRGFRSGSLNEALPLTVLHSMG